jgi:hypothetical protein
MLARPHDFAYIYPHTHTHTSSTPPHLSAALYSTMLSRALFAKQRVRVIEAELLLRDLAAAGRIDEVAPALRRRAEFLRAVGAARATVSGGDSRTPSDGGIGTSGSIHASSTGKSTASKIVASAAVEAVAVVQRAAAAARRAARGGHSARAPKQPRPL